MRRGLTSPSATKPGGYVELTELGSTVHTDNSWIISADNPVQRYSLLFNKAMNLLGRPPALSSILRSRLEGAGFVDIHLEPIKQPLGSWPQGKTARQLGAMIVASCETGFHAYGLYAFTRVLGLGLEEADKLCSEAYEAVKEGTDHLYSYMYVPINSTGFLVKFLL